MLRDRRPSLRRSPLADRRGVGVAEYALLLFIVIAGVAIAYRFIGKSVKHAGNKTEEQFQGGGQGGSNNNKTASNANSAGGTSTSTAGGTAAGGGGGASGGGAGGGGAASANAGGGKTASSDTPGGASGEEEEDTRSTPLWKIIGGVFLLLFAIGGYFAFRKQSKGG